MHLSPGTRLGRYEVRSLLGAGGMGEVYVAYDHDLEREVAVKVLRDGASEGGDRGRRFIQEAKAASALHHPNVAHVYEIGTHDDLRFIAMEIVEGETLRDRVARGPLAIDDALAIGLQIASALAAAHKAGIVHRRGKAPGRIRRVADDERHPAAAGVGILRLGRSRGHEQNGKREGQGDAEKAARAVGSHLRGLPTRISARRLALTADRANKAQLRRRTRCDQPAAFALSGQATISAGGALANKWAMALA